MFPAFQFKVSTEIYTQWNEFTLLKCVKKAFLF